MFRIVLFFFPAITSSVIAHANGLWSAHSCAGVATPGNETIEFETKVWDNGGGFEHVPAFTEIIINRRGGKDLEKPLLYYAANNTSEDEYHCKRFGEQITLRHANVGDTFENSGDIENAIVKFDCNDEMGVVVVNANCKHRK